MPSSPTQNPRRKVNTNWIFKYAETISKFSEAPDAYNVWCAISVISAVLKKKVWLNRGTFKIYPNQYIVLVGPPGVGKGSAMHPAHDFVRNHKPAPLANYISDRVTAPRIIEILAGGFSQPVAQGIGMPTIVKEASAVLMCAELQTFLGSSDWMLSFLCDAWDRNSFEYDTRNKGTLVVKNMCVSMLGACVPEFIRKIDKNTGEAVNGGFTARTLFIFAGEKSKSLAWPRGFDGTPESIKIADDLSEDLDAISRLNGEFSFTPEAKISWERAYHGIKPGDEDSNVVASFKSRQGIHIMKVAMCLSAAQNDSLIIDDYCMRTAISLTDQVLKSLDITFRGVGESPLAEATAKIQAFIEKKGMAHTNEILKHSYRNVTREDLDRILFVLCQIGFCDAISSSNRTYYRHIDPKGTPANVPSNGSIPPPFGNP